MPKTDTRVDTEKYDSLNILSNGRLLAHYSLTVRNRIRLLSRLREETDANTLPPAPPRLPRRTVLRR